MKFAALIFALGLLFVQNSIAQEPHWKMGFGIGPNVTQLDVVDDDLGSSFGAAIWGSRSWGEHHRLDLSFDYFSFKGSGRNYPGLSLAYGLEFNQNKPWKFFGLLGLGTGQANKFPRAADQHQTPTHLFLRLGADEIYKYQNWSVGLVFDYLYVDLDDNPATNAQLGLPMVSFTYKWDNKPKPVIAEKSKPVDSDSDGVYDHKDECPDTPLGTKVNSIGCPKKVKVRKVLRVEFETAKSNILSEFIPNVEEFAKFLIENSDLEVTIEGHTDSVGSRAYNLKLSEARAHSVRQALIDRGIEPGRIQAVGFGPDKPETTNETVEGRSRNRRVIAVLVTLK